MSRVQQPNPRPTESGFTMVELMVVIVILGLLGTMVGTGVLGNLFSSQKDIATMQVKEHHSTLKLYFAQKRKLPEELAELKEPDPDRNDQPWIEALTDDPWGNSYRIVAGDRQGQFEVVSNGPDGMEDTEDDIRYPPADDENN